jgi:hypothetical protein
VEDQPVEFGMVYGKRLPFLRWQKSVAAQLSSKSLSCSLKTVGLQEELSLTTRSSAQIVWENSFLEVPEVRAWLES